MKEQFDISVIMPIYNTQSYIREALESILNQSKKNIELIAINDGSTDKSGDIAKEYANTYSNILYLEQVNKGQGAARNVGLKNARGKYVYFMDSDDILENSALQVLYDQCQGYDLDMIIFDGESFYDENYISEDKKSFKYTRNKVYGGVYNGAVLLDELINNRDYYVSPCLYMFKKEIVMQKGLYFPEGIIHEDELFSFQLYLYANKVKHISAVFFKRRIRGNSTMTSNNYARSFQGYSQCLLELMDKQEIYKKDYRGDLGLVEIIIKKELRKLYNAILRTFHGMNPSERANYREQFRKVKSKAREQAYFGKRYGFFESNFYYFYHRLLDLKKKV
ncbi:glycosyltransferase [Alkalibaculum bacchi]|uniref:glycosyltransferase family 2 protein n=1 Tax=Alkalibaculum bacchi TaxID=645887 RepID=UPI0026EA8BC3|nr:glycosyltransferase [Alkalibaculum bacchi]